MININDIQWRWATLDKLSAKDFYAVAKLRQDVFILEQACLFADLDGLDLQTHHLLGTYKDDLVGYLRVLFPEKSRDPVYLSRIITPLAYRGKGIGRILVAQGLSYIDEQAPKHEVVISAQVNLEEFYKGFGFKRVGSPYLEDGIPHIAMRRSGK